MMSLALSRESLTALLVGKWKQMLIARGSTSVGLRRIMLVKCNRFGARGLVDW